MDQDKSKLANGLTAEKTSESSLQNARGQLSSAQSAIKTAKSLKEGAKSALRGVEANVAAATDAAKKAKALSQTADAVAGMESSSVDATQLAFEHDVKLSGESLSEANKSHEIVKALNTRIANYTASTNRMNSTQATVVDEEDEVLTRSTTAARTREQVEARITQLHLKLDLMKKEIRRSAATIDAARFNLTLRTKAWKKARAVARIASQKHTTAQDKLNVAIKQAQEMSSKHLEDATAAATAEKTRQVEAAGADKADERLRNTERLVRRTSHLLEQKLIAAAVAKSQQHAARHEVSMALRNQLVVMKRANNVARSALAHAQRNYASTVKHRQTVEAQLRQLISAKQRAHVLFDKSPGNAFKKKSFLHASSAVTRAQALLDAAIMREEKAKWQQKWQEQMEKKKKAKKA